MNMLDTVILTIPKKSYNVIHPEMFTPNARVLNEPGNYLVPCVNNPTAKDKTEGRYRPRLTLMKRITKNGTEMPLKIEFSVSKILFGNSIEEVSEKDFDDVVNRLHDTLWGIGVYVSKDNLRYGTVVAFHPSKNIELQNGYTSSFVIKELAKINVNKKLDLDRSNFRNNGQSMQCYANSHSLVFYDKVLDLSKPLKRAVDKDQSWIQRSLFEFSRKRHLEILRIEARLSKKVKLNTLLISLGYAPNPTFKDVFNKKLCQDIILHDWNQIIQGENLFLFDMDSNPKTILQKVFREKPGIKPKQAIYLVGFKLLCKEGMQELRQAVETHSSVRTWYTITDDLGLMNELSTPEHHDWVRQINDVLKAFDAYELSTSTM